jgi:hypothetical protein
MYLGDRGTIDVEAFAIGDRTYIVYRVWNAPVPGAPPDARQLAARAVEIL